jgi:23S rRNA (uracil1939-C5)-methyltransferase
MSKPARATVALAIDNLSHEGRGVARDGGKTVFVHGALPGERVTARITSRRGRYDEAETVAVETASAARVTPPCPHYGICGGCSLQHATRELQLAHKQSVLLELLQHHAGLRPARVLAPIAESAWGYRRKARLGVKWVEKKGGILLGFRERAKPYVADCRQCDVLEPRVGALLSLLRELITGLSAPTRIPQIEVAVSDQEVGLVLRHLTPLTAADRARLHEFGLAHGIRWFLQSGGYDSVVALDGRTELLEYRIDDLRFAFAPTDFTQVNAEVNRRMIEQALALLALTPTDTVLDLYCGIGNFTLPIARRAARVLGFEGAASAVARARHNAHLNSIANVEFVALDLDDPRAAAKLEVPPGAKLLLDPPRAGAEVVLATLDLRDCACLVYVSCNPVTLARDSAILRARHGFELSAAGILDMFPHTAHVESMACFVRA